MSCDYMIRCKQAMLNPPLLLAIIRAEGAQQNGFENICIFAAGVVAGNAAGLGAGCLIALSAAYIASTVVYHLIYVNSTTPAAANMRSIVFVSSSALIITMFVSVGIKMGEVGG